MADISQIKLPNGDIFDLVDESKSTATNWVNGSQTGSVRAINSAVEGSSYTIGQYAVAEGQSTKATGKYSHAEGGGTTASGTGSHAEGAGTQAKGANSHAEGGGAIANGNQSHAEGSATTAGGPDSHAEGNYTTASGDASHAEGGGTQASGQYSHAEGASTVASNNKDHAEGYQTTASGGCAHAEGYGTVASGLDSHAEGDSTIANHLAQHVFGRYNIADTSTATADNKGKYVEIVGNGSYNARSNARTLDWSGNEVLSGKLTVGVTGTNSLDVATISQLPTKTSDLTNDSNFISDSAYIHTDNNYTTIEKNKLNSIAEGAEANVNADWNENDSTSASYIQNRPFYLEEDVEVVLFDEDVAINSSAYKTLYCIVEHFLPRSIALNTPVTLTVDDVTLNTTVEIENDTYFIGIKDPGDVTRADLNHIGMTFSAVGSQLNRVLYIVVSSTVFSTGTHHAKLTTVADVYHKLDNNYLDLNIKNGGGGSINSIQQINSVASASYSSAFGTGKATGVYAHAEGHDTTASGDASHVEGRDTTASGSYAHAEGYSTTASRYGAHAEGRNTTASGDYSHAEGSHTIANHACQHVFGQYNIEDSSTAYSSNKGTYVEIVGNGTGVSARSNARTLDWSGNEWLAGKLTVGTAGTNTMDVATIGQLPTKTSDLTNDSGFITSYTETDPIFTASAAAGITATDISNWNSKVSDDKTWNGVVLNKSITLSGQDLFFPSINNASTGTESYFVRGTSTPTQYALAKYNANAYLYSTTPSANDNSTKVATTAYVDNAVGSISIPIASNSTLGGIKVGQTLDIDSNGILNTNIYHIYIVATYDYETEIYTLTPSIPLIDIIRLLEQGKNVLLYLKGDKQGGPYQYFGYNSVDHKYYFDCNDVHNLYDQIYIYSYNEEYEISYYSNVSDQLLIDNLTYGALIYSGKLQTLNNDQTTNDLLLPNKSGTIALTSDISTYTAGTGIDITNGVISVNLDSAEGGTY